MSLVKMCPVKNCQACPACKFGLTKGYGYALDYYCTFKPVGKDENRWGFRIIKGYVECEAEAPQNHEFPEWCPL